MGYKVYLNIPYDEEEKAKELGANWSKQEKKWYFFIDDETEEKEQALRYLRFAKWQIDKKSKLSEINLNNIPNVSIKMGENIGKSLLSRLYDAKNRIYICSPYLDKITATYLDELNSKKEEIDFKVLFSIKDFKTKDILENFVGYKLEENLGAKYENQKIIENLEKNIKKYKVFSGIFSAIFIGIIIYLYFSGLYTYIKEYPLLALPLVIVFLIINLFFYKKIRTSVNYKSDYEKKDFHYLDFFSKINHRILLEHKEETLPHLNLYIIDNTVFLGSVNFSNNNLFFNIESLVEIKDLETVEKLADFFNELYHYPFKTTNDSNTINNIGDEIYNKWEIIEKSGINDFY